MTRRSVFAFLGDTESIDAIARLRTTSTEIVAVAVDLGGGLSLGELHSAALQAGATRCHALDVREEFLRSIVLPALRTGWFAGDPLVESDLVVRFVNDQLRTIAEIEGASIVERRGPVSIQRRMPAPVAGPVLLELAFSRGVPVAVNDVVMTLTELMESIQTISGLPPFVLIRQAYSELPRSGDGEIAMRIDNGRPEMVAVAVAV
jgi:argininosuccinate synthase